MPIRRLRALLPGCAIALALLGLSIAPASAGGTLKRLIPDIVTLEPSGFDIETPGDQRILRFGNEIANRGRGVLELVPRRDDCDGDGQLDDDRSTYQRLYVDTNGNRRFDRGTDQALERMRFAGCSVYHPEPGHEHWHFEHFAKYQLLRASDSTVVRVAEKVSFCIVDTRRQFPQIPGSPPSSYYNQCDRSSTNGLSVGWSDIYGAYLPGQEFDITTLEDGQYCLVSTADPANLLKERNEGNNTGSALIDIQGETVSELPGACPA